MKAKVALTGAGGNMGREAVRQLMKLEDVEFVRILIRKTPKDKSVASKLAKDYGKRLQIVEGDLAVADDCRATVEGVDYVFHIAAIIPPVSDHKPKATDLANRIGTINMVNACLEQKKQPKFVYTSTVAVYGHRNYIHPWGRVGDPLLPSVYDVYAASKVKAERYVLESNLKNWAIIRQTAMLHYNMMKDNMSDGLMFHTCLNVPLEWVTSEDSGLLIKRIVERDLEHKADAFWKHCFNIGGGEASRLTGYDSFDKFFSIFGMTVEKVMRPGWHTIRNFHGLWFADGNKLNDIFDFQHVTYDDFCKILVERNPIFKVASAVPSSLISKIGFQRLLDDVNSPSEWIKNDDIGRIRAYFGSYDNVECRVYNWKDFPVLCKGELPDCNIDYEAMRNIANVGKLGYLLDHGYDESKDDLELNLDDMRSAAAFRGGACLSSSMKQGDLYTPLKWKCHDGHVFKARPYTILKAGHWCPECCQPQPWDFDRLSKFMPFYAQVWYDSHAKGENTQYFMNGTKALYTRF